VQRRLERGQTLDQVAQQGGAPPKLDGSSLMRNYVTQMHGISVCRVPVWAMPKEHVATPEFASWLREELAAHGMPTVDADSDATAPLLPDVLVSESSDKSAGSEVSVDREAQQRGSS
jgi:hypothetical protein